MAEEIVQQDIEQEEYLLNMGPQHPSTHGVLRLLISLKGETVANIEPHCGYIHRGIEKMCEKLTYQQIIHENALKIEVPERVKYIRTIISELSRIASHELWWCAFGMDMGALTTYFYGLRDREKILDIFEETTGGRLLQSYNCPGGLMNDIHPNFVKRVKEFIPYFRKKLPEYDELLTGNVIMQERTLKAVLHRLRWLAYTSGLLGIFVKAKRISENESPHDAKEYK